MKKEIEKGLPIVMLCHVPMYTPEHAKKQLENNNGRCAYMTGAPLELTKNISVTLRFRKRNNGVTEAYNNEQTNQRWNSLLGSRNNLY